MEGKTPAEANETGQGFWRDTLKLSYGFSSKDFEVVDFQTESDPNVREMTWQLYNAYCSETTKVCTFTVSRAINVDPAIIDLPLQIATSSSLSVGNQGLDGVFTPIRFSSQSGAFGLLAASTALIASLMF